jgi:hypothetical protein
LFEVANTNNTTDAVDIGYYGRYYDAVQERVEFTGLFRDASDAGKFKIFSGLVDEPTNVVNTTGTGYTVATLVANVDGNLAGIANAANILSTARTIAASGDAAWSVSFDGSANVTSALTLANTGVTATTYGTSTAVPTIAVDSKGRITSASNTNITFPVTTVNGFAGTVVLTTSDVAEGTNQYFTTARAQASITGGASSVVTANLTASRALVSDGSGKIAASATTTTTEVGYLAGVTSAIQTQLDSKLNLTGGTLTGGLIGTTGSFSSSGSGDTFTIGHTSGSGIALNITKNGNGEGLYINKASGSGNAATIIGTLNATTLVKSGGTASQFLKADGSVDSSTYLTTSAASSTYLTIATASSTYLPLSGGTLTGALSGTSATFSGVLTAKTGFSVAGTNASPVFEDWLTSIPNGSSTFTKIQIGNSFASSAGTWMKFVVNSNTAGNTPVDVMTLKYDGSTTFSGDVSLANSKSLRLLGGSLRILNSSGSATYGYFISNNAWKGSGNNNPSIAADSGLGINFFTNGSTTEAMTITSGGNVGIGTNIPDERLTIGSGNGMSIRTLASGTYGVIKFGTTNSAFYSSWAGIDSDWEGQGQNVSNLRFYTAFGGNATERMRISSSGYISLNNIVYNNTVNTSPRTLYIESGTGSLGGISSIRASKKNIQDIENVDWIYQLNPVTFNYRKKDEDGNYTDESHDELFYGLIAEDTAPIADFLVNYNDKEDGSKEMVGIEYMRLITPMLKAIQKLEARVKELEAK